MTTFESTHFFWPTHICAYKGLDMGRFWGQPYFSYIRVPLTNHPINGSIWCSQYSYYSAPNKRRSDEITDCLLFTLESHLRVGSHPGFQEEQAAQHSTCWRNCSFWKSNLWAEGTSATRGDGWV